VLIDSGADEIDVQDAALNTRSDKRAIVNLEVVTDTGKRYPVVYSMYLNDQDNWMLENVIVFGVNIGLAFRDRFESQYRYYKGDIDQVIAHWASKLDIVAKPER
jgi:phospholipid transport system substrate-binding protein